MLVSDRAVKVTGMVREVAPSVDPATGRCRRVTIDAYQTGEIILRPDRDRFAKPLCRPPPPRAKCLPCVGVVSGVSAKASMPQSP